MEYQKLSKRLLTHLRGSLPMPVFTWLLVLIWTVLVGVTVVGYGYYHYYTLTTAQALVTPGSREAPRQVIDVAMLKQALEHYNRAQE